MRSAPRCAPAGRSPWLSCTDSRTVVRRDTAAGQPLRPGQPPPLPRGRPEQAGPAVRFTMPHPGRGVIVARWTRRPISQRILAPAVCGVPAAAPPPRVRGRLLPGSAPWRTARASTSATRAPAPTSGRSRAGSTPTGGDTRARPPARLPRTPVGRASPQLCLGGRVGICRSRRSAGRIADPNLAVHAWLRLVCVGRRDAHPPRRPPAAAPARSGSRGSSVAAFVSAAPLPARTWRFAQGSAAPASAVALVSAVRGAAPACRRTGLAVHAWLRLACRRRRVTAAVPSDSASAAVLAYAPAAALSSPHSSALSPASASSASGAYSRNPGSQDSSSSRSRTVAPNWQSTPIVLSVTRWISR